MEKHTDLVRKIVINSLWTVLMFGTFENKRKHLEYLSVLDFLIKNEYENLEKYNKIIFMAYRFIVQEKGNKKWL